MSKEKVKVVFEFDKKDYENVLFLMDRENDAHSKEFWNVMSERDVVLSLDYISEQTGQKKENYCCLWFLLQSLWLRNYIITNSIVWK